MAKLTKEQEQAVRQWADEGANLNEIQDRLSREHQVSLTYLDARLLVIELGLKLQEKKQELAAEKTPEPAPGAAPVPEAALEADVLSPSAPAGAGKVSIIIDQIAIPGMMVSGKVTFSDGKTVGWQLDQFGSLAMHGAEPGYQPPRADIPVFQRDLDAALQRAGY